MTDHKYSQQDSEMLPQITQHSLIIYHQRLHIIVNTSVIHNKRRNV